MGRALYIWDSWENTMDVCLRHLGKWGKGFFGLVWFGLVGWFCSCVIFFEIVATELCNADFEDVKFPQPSSLGLSPSLTAQYTNASCLVPY